MAEKILYAGLPGFKPLPNPSVLKTAAHGYEVLSVADKHSARLVLESSENIRIFALNAPMLELFEIFHARFPKGAAILITDETLETYSEALEGKEYSILDHVIANRTPSEWTVNELRVTLQKIARNDVFGIDKYFGPQTRIQARTITGSKDREPCNQAVLKFAEDNKLGRYIAKIAYSISEELLMNAIYDAPAAAGRDEYRGESRDVALKEADYAHLAFGFDGKVLAIGVRDPFGSLAKDKYFSYMKKVLVRHNTAKLIDTKKEGAGLGLYKILYSSHAIVCNLAPGKATEIISLIDVNFQVRDFAKIAKSIHFFIEK